MRLLVTAALGQPSPGRFEVLQRVFEDGLGLWDLFLVGGARDEQERQQKHERGETYGFSGRLHGVVLQVEDATNAGDEAVFDHRRSLRTPSL